MSRLRFLLLTHVSMNRQAIDTIIIKWKSLYWDLVRDNLSNSVYMNYVVISEPKYWKANYILN